MATNYKLKPFRFNLDDLNFMRDQINFRPLFDASGNALINWDGTGAIFDLTGTQYDTTGMNAAAAITAFGTSYASVTAAEGLREVTGQNNNLLLVNKFWGAVDQPFLQTVAPDFSNYVKPLAAGEINGFYAAKTFGTSTTGSTDYTKTQALPGGSQLDGNIVDYTPRMISRTITTGGATPLQDATVDGGQVLHWNAARYATDSTYAAAVDTVSVGGDGLIEGAAIMSDVGILAGGQHDPQDPTNGEFFFGAINPGVAPGNSWLAYFGQFFDHGLDFVGKGGGQVPSKITIPLALDDPLYRAPNTNFPGDPGNTKITVSRADISGFDANGNAQWVNHTSPYIDQSQTYGSHEQMTQLLREWVTTDGGNSFHTGAELLDGITSAAWTNAWNETTTATLPTLNELRAHLLATGRDDLTWADVLNLRNRDASGHVIDSDLATAGVQSTGSGQALLLDMNPHFDTAHLSAATQAALSAAGIAPDSNGNYALGGPGSLGAIINFATFEPMASSGSDPLNALALDVLIESVGDHYIAGDGRVNENIGLTTIHHVFHEEHNFQVRNLQEAILAQDARQVTLDAAGTYDHSVAHDWQVDTGNGTDAQGNYLTATNAISWDEGKLFDAAKLTVEMEYQHAAVDQYARTITPDIPEFVGYNSGENATVSLEYAQGAFRFGHSTMRETINYMDPNGSITGKVMSVALEQAFLNPALFAEKGAASIALGMTHQQMNEIDELLTPAMNQGLLGMPLDLAAINIARGRDVGLPTLNDFREAVGLTRYSSWADFGDSMVHPESLVNFIAAYSFDGDVGRAQAVVGLVSGEIAEGTEAAYGYTTNEAINFINGGDNGFNKIDTWIGGLAEVHVMGGLLGETFNVVFVDQINRLMDGDRFYYLYRLNNMQMGDEIANAQFKDIIERNTGLEHLNGSAFAYADQYVDLTETATGATLADRLLNQKTEHKYGDTLAANPTLGVYSTNGTSTNSNGALITVSGVQYIRDLRVEGANGNPNVNGTNLDGTPDTGANSNEVLVGTDHKDLIYMWAGDDTAYGEGDNDIIYGGAGIDRLYGGDGNDTIFGGDSGDLIDGGDGDDTLYGESSGTAAAGLDQIIGGAGNDLIYGGVGIDKISGGSGDDVIFGGGDTDAFTHGGDGNDYIDGGSDGDLLWGDGGDDLIVGGDNQDIVAGLDGDDILRPGIPSSAAGGGPDEVLGGDGAGDRGNDGEGVGFDLIDFSDYASATVGVNADFATQQNPLVAIDGTTPFPAWVGIEGVIGSRNNDTVLADANGNWLIGGSGSDTLTGAGGNDVIVGDGIRLDSLIGSYATSYTSEFDGASHRALGFMGNNGLLGNVALGTDMFDKHFTEMLKSEMFKNLELGGSTMTPLLGGGITGDGGTAATGGASGSDVAVFTGNFAEYTFALVQVDTANQGEISAWKFTDTVLGRDGTDVLVGIELARFADGDVSLAAVASLNATPVITSNGGAAAAAITVAENTSAVTTVTATDANVADTLTYSIDGGADAALFTIDAAGVLSLIAAPNFEAPTDAGANRVYDVLVKVSDGAAHDFQAIAVTVQNVDEAATGSVSITGYSSPLGTVATLGAANTLADPDGMSNFAKYQWQRFDGSSWVNIPGAAGNGATLATTVANTTNATLRFASAYTDVFGNKTFVADETVYTGNAVANTIVASAGRDFVLGLGGNDTLTGGLGTDTVDGGAGNDTLLATLGDGNDAYNGGLGIDTYNLSATAAAADVNLTTGLASSLETGSDTLAGIENVAGSSGANLMTDAVGANSLSGNAGDDTFVLLGDDARDVITGGVGNDTVDYALATADLIVNLSTATAVVTGTGTTAALSDTVNTIENFIAGAGNDTITGSALANQLVGGAGNDLLNGLAGADTLIGGAGDDTYVVDNAGDVVAESAAEGTDTVQASVSHTLATDFENLTLLGAGAISGTGNDVVNIITGNGGNNILTGGIGDDTVDGGAGNDTLLATLGDGNDAYNGGLGIDTYNLSATAAAADVNLTTGLASSLETGSDTLAGIENVVGSSGDDTITGDANANTLTGGAGNDTYVASAGTDTYTEAANAGIDTVLSSLNNFTLSANFEDLTLTGIANINGTGNTIANVLTGNSGDNILNGGAGADTLIGGAGDDTYVVDNVGDVVVESAAEGADTVQASVSHTLATDFENLTLLGAGAINATGNDFVNIITGNSGNNILTGGLGTDTVDGGAGNDTLLATVGDGNDAYNGGLGIDTYNLSATAAAADVNLTTGFASSLETGSDTLAGIENVLGSSGANLMTDAVGANSLSGNAGDDTFVLLGDDARDVITGGVGNDTVDYATATADLTVNLSTATAVVTGTGTTAALSDTVNTIENFIAGAGNDSVTGSALANQLVGGAGNDILSGLAGADILDGGAGSDTLTGGAGADILTGGSEADVFDFNLYTESGNGAAVRDRITDFLSGTDTLDFSGIDANTVVATDQVFTFNAVDGAAFTAAGQLIFHYEGSGASEITVIEGNIDAVLGTDFQVALVGHHALTAADFVL